MPPKSTKETLVFVTNNGASEHSEQGKIFIDTAKEVIQLIIEKKIFLRPRDEVGMILKAEEFHPVQVCSWEMVQRVKDMDLMRCHSNDWISGVQVAVQLCEEQVFHSSRTTIVLLSDYFDTDVLNEKKMRNVASSIIEKDLLLLCIGTKDLKTLERNELNNSEKMLLDFIELASGEYRTFEDTLPSFRIFGVPSKSNPSAWKCDLEISDIKIKIKEYLKVTNEKALPSWGLMSLDAPSDNLDTNVPVIKAGQLVDKMRNVHELADANQGYQFGREFIPLTEHDVNHLYVESRKSFILYGFADEQTVMVDFRTGSQTHVLLPGEGAEPQFFALVKAMADKKQVGLVRKVYADKYAPKMNVLYPHIGGQDEPPCLYVFEIIFADERSVIDPRPYLSILKRITQEQVTAVDDLIDQMMLTDRDFEDGTVPDPSIQHTWNRLCHRALEPDSPLPEPGDHLMKLIRTPEFITNDRFDRLVNNVMNLYPIPTEEELKKEAESNKNENSQGNKTANVMEVDEIEENQNPSSKKKSDDSAEKDVSPAHPTPSVDLDNLFDDD